MGSIHHIHFRAPALAFKNCRSREGRLAHALKKDDIMDDAGRFIEIFRVMS
jgi:hypothetical protein